MLIVLLQLHVFKKNCYPTICCLSNIQFIQYLVLNCPFTQLKPKFHFPSVCPTFSSRSCPWADLSARKVQTFSTLGHWSFDRLPRLYIRSLALKRRAISQLRGTPERPFAPLVPSPQATDKQKNTGRGPTENKPQRWRGQPGWCQDDRICQGYRYRWLNQYGLLWLPGNWDCAV